MQRILVLVTAFSAVVLVGSSGWQATARATQDEEKGRAEPRSVTLRLAGDTGTPFSGSCSVGAREQDIGGRIPQSFDFEPNGRKLTCEVRTQGARGAELKALLLKDGVARSVQRSAGSEDTAIRLSYQNGSVSSSVSSSTSQKMSSAGSSPHEGSSDARRWDHDRESLADKIREKVARIIERATP